MENFDLIIVGGGFIGHALALALGPSALQIAVLESAPVFAQDKRSLVLSYGSQLILKRYGLWDSLAATATPLRSIHISDAGHFGMMKLNAVEEGVPALGYVVEGQHLLSALIHKIKQFSNIHVLQPAHLQALQKEKTTWQLTVKLNDQIKLLRAKFLIGADGAQSTVRKSLNIEAEHYDYQQTAIISRVGLNRSHDNVGYERFIPGGSIAILPRSDDSVGLVLCVPSTRALSWLNLSDAEFLKKLQQSFGYRLGKFLNLEKRSTYPLQRLRAVKQTGSGFVLVGNAAQVLHPIAAQGFNLGLRDIKYLAEILMEAEDFSNLDLTHYALTRQKDQAATLQFTDRLVKFFTPDFGPFNVTRNIATTLLGNIPFLKHKIARQAMGAIRLGV